MNRHPRRRKEPTTNQKKFKVEHTGNNTLGSHRSTFEQRCSLALMEDGRCAQVCRRRSCSSERSSPNSPSPPSDTAAIRYPPHPDRRHCRRRARPLRPGGRCSWRRQAAPDVPRRRRLTRAAYQHLTSSCSLFGNLIRKPLEAGRRGAPTVLAPPEELARRARRGGGGRGAGGGRGEAGERPSACLCSRHAGLSHLASSPPLPACARGTRVSPTLPLPLLCLSLLAARSRYPGGGGEGREG